MENIDILKEKIMEWGATKYGFSNLTGVVPQRYRNLKYGISIVVRLSDAIINEIDDKPTHTYFHHYRSVNTLIDSITLKTMLLIQEWGYPAVAIPASQTVKSEDDIYTGIFQHKTAARLSSLGWIGKSGLLVTPEFGPRVRLGTVITSMELPVQEVLNYTGCGGCSACRDACPAKAIYGVEWSVGMPRSEILNAKACSEYMKTKFKLIGRGSVCGICMRVCRSGEKVLR